MCTYALVDCASAADIHVSVRHACARTRPKRAPGVTGGKFAQQVTIASFGRLAAYVALTTAVVRCAKDKGTFITARQRVGQTTKDYATKSMHTAASARRCPS